MTIENGLPNLENNEGVENLVDGENLGFFKKMSTGAKGIFTKAYNGLKKIPPVDIAMGKVGVAYNQYWMDKKEEKASVAKIDYDYAGVEVRRLDYAASEITDAMESLKDDGASITPLELELKKIEKKSLKKQDEQNRYQSKLEKKVDQVKLYADERDHVLDQLVSKYEIKLSPLKDELDRLLLLGEEADEVLQIARAKHEEEKQRIEELKEKKKRIEDNYRKGLSFNIRLREINISKLPDAIGLQDQIDRKYTKIAKEEEKLFAQKHEIDKKIAKAKEKVRPYEDEIRKVINKKELRPRDFNVQPRESITNRKPDYEVISRVRNRINNSFEDNEDENSDASQMPQNQPVIQENNIPIAPQETNPIVETGAEKLRNAVEGDSLMFTTLKVPKKPTAQAKKLETPQENIDPSDDEAEIIDDTNPEEEQPPKKEDEKKKKKPKKFWKRFNNFFFGLPNDNDEEDPSTPSTKPELKPNIITDSAKNEKKPKKTTKELLNKLLVKAMNFLQEKPKPLPFEKFSDAEITYSENDEPDKIKENENGKYGVNIELLQTSDGELLLKVYLKMNLGNSNWKTEKEITFPGYETLHALKSADDLLKKYWKKTPNKFKEKYMRIKESFKDKLNNMASDMIGVEEPDLSLESDYKTQQPTNNASGSLFLDSKQKLAIPEKIIKVPTLTESDIQDDPFGILKVQPNSNGKYGINIYKKENGSYVIRLMEKIPKSKEYEGISQKEVSSPEDAVKLGNELLKKYWKGIPKNGKK